MATTERRHDLHLTTSGVALHYTPARYFPPSNFKSFLKDPLPLKLREKDTLHPYDEVFNNFETTTGSTHNLKTIGGLLGHPRHVKVPNHWNVHYMKDLSEKLSRRDWRTPLNMVNQTSEMKDKYTGRLPQTLDTAFKAGPQPFNLANHHTNGPSKNIIASTENPALAGKEYYVRDKDVLRLNDIYLTTTNKDFRAFKKEELEGFPKKDIPTYWEMEDYPKTWGHGLKENPLPKDAQRIVRGPGPMTDPSVFQAATRIPPLPKHLPPVPNRGLKTQYQDVYQQPNDVKRKQDLYYQFQAPWVMTRAGSTPEILSVPHMYKTEYMSYGNERPVIM
ncbi:stabilizer of axonemal microtubules 3 [Chiloscyllium punctatum]|uniref:stabilizer of axonemal microtubules 3 n=1 Tax=Chiloscyllium punctatum TaxID=137246 RepID=UPI003B637530